MRVAVAAESDLIDMHLHRVEMGCRLNRAQAPSCDLQLTLYTQTQHSCYRRIYACSSAGRRKRPHRCRALTSEMGCRLQQP